MATPSTMRPLAPAKPAGTSSNKTPTSTTTKVNSNTTKGGKVANGFHPRKLAPAPIKIAPSNQANQTKPSITAKPRPFINQQKIQTNDSQSSSPIKQTSSNSVRKLTPLAISMKSEVNPQTSKQSILTPKETKPESNIPTTSSDAGSSDIQTKQTPPQKERMSRQDDEESSAISDDDFSDHDDSQSPDPITPSSTSTNLQSATRDIEGDAVAHLLMSGDKIQPKKEWVLPARAKPGRKPSEVEPPTKRKAQNRASQRAFRERRQSYLASLEAKVNEYEERGATISTELQKVAKKLKEENDSLKQENSFLHSKVHQLEIALKVRNSGESGSSRSTRGEDPTLASSQSVITRYETGIRDEVFSDDLPRRTSWDWSAGSSKGEENAVLLSPPQKKSAELQRDCGFCTEQSPCLCSGEAVLDFPNPSSSRTQSQPSQRYVQSSSIPLRAHPERRSNNRQKLWYTVSASQRSTRQVQICPTSNMRRMNGLRALHDIPSPMMIRNGSSMLPPLHFPRKANLWPIYPLTSPNKINVPSSAQMILSSSQQLKSPQTPPFPSPTIFRMKKQSANTTPAVCSGDPSDCAACATDPALAAFCKAVSSHLHADGTMGNAVILDTGNALPLRKPRMRGMSNPMTRQYKGSNYTFQLPPQNSYTNENRMTTSTLPKPRLWSVSPNNSQDEPNVVSKSITSSTLPNSTSLHPHTTSDVRGEVGKSNAHDTVKERIETIPEAWQRIKQHPSFANWQGGLDLLADVVTRKSFDESQKEIQSPSLRPKDQGRNVLLPETQVKSKGDRSNDHISTLQGKQNDEEEEDLGRKRRMMELDQSPKNDSILSSHESSSQNHKRRKLYVDRRRVDDVLALLDRGTPNANSPSTSQTPPSVRSSSADEGQSCACPLSKIM